ncbi:hypothetical protein GS458_1849 [Geobacillus stearothermophilus]|nr:hypothetical protein GS458_1849 [Geobacillus stearothermophilus]
MPKIGHLCFPIAFFGHFQYTLTDQERIPHSPSGGDFHGKSLLQLIYCYSLSLYGFLFLSNISDIKKAHIEKRGF